MQGTYTKSMQNASKMMIGWDKSLIVFQENAHTATIKIIMIIIIIINITITTTDSVGKQQFSTHKWYR
jgi:hypothetical protein